MIRKFKFNERGFFQSLDRGLKTVYNFFSIYLITFISGDSGLAEYGIIISAFNIFILFTNCGYDHFLFRYFSGISHRNSITNLSISLKYRFFAILFFMSLFQLYFYIFSHETIYKIIYLYPVMLISTSDIIETYLIARKIEIKYFKIKMMLLFFLNVFKFLVFWLTKNLEMFYILFAIESFIIILYAAFYSRLRRIWRITNFNRHFFLRNSIFKEILTYSIVTLSITIYLRFDLFVLAHLNVKKTELSAFFLSYTIAQVVMIPIYSLYTIYKNEIVEQSDEIKLEFNLLKIMKLVIVYISLCFVVLISIYLLSFFQTPFNFKKILQILPVHLLINLMVVFSFFFSTCVVLGKHFKMAVIQPLSSAVIYIIIYLIFNNSLSLNSVLFISFLIAFYNSILFNLFFNLKYLLNIKRSTLKQLIRS